MWFRKKPLTQAELARNAITMPATAAMCLLELSKTNNGLNLGTVRRSQDWCWSTYTYLFRELGEYRGEVQKTLELLDKMIKDFNWDRVGSLAYDGWDEAKDFQNEHYMQ